MMHWMRAASMLALGLSLTACGRGMPMTASNLAPRMVHAKSLAGVSAAVKATMAAEFRDQDRDQNLQLSLMEFKGSGFHSILVAKGRDVKALNLTEHFKALDVDGNASLSMGEFIGPMLTERNMGELRAVAATLFKRADRNHDDHVTHGEVLPDALDIDVALVDRNGDMKIDLSEFEDALYAGLLPVVVVGPATPGEIPASTQSR